MWKQLSCFYSCATKTSPTRTVQNSDNFYGSVASVSFFSKRRKNIFLIRWMCMLGLERMEMNFFSSISQFFWMSSEIYYFSFPSSTTPIQPPKKAMLLFTLKVNISASRKIILVLSLTLLRFFRGDASFFPTDQIKVEHLKRHERVLMKRVEL